MAENAAESEVASAIIACANGSARDDKETLTEEARGETGEGVSEESSSQLDGCNAENGVSQSEEARYEDTGEPDGEQTHSNETASDPLPSKQADQAVAVETPEGETTEAEEWPSSETSHTVKVKEQPQCDPPSGANESDPAPDAVPPVTKPRCSSTGPPVETRRRDTAKCSYNTVSYRNIRKGNTRQRIDEFESMMYTN